MEYEKKADARMEKGDPEHYLGSGFFYGTFLDGNQPDIAVFYGSCDLADFKGLPVRKNFIDLVTKFEYGENLETIEAKLHPTDEAIIPGEDLSLYVSRLPTRNNRHAYHCGDQDLINAGFHFSYEDCADAIKEAARLYHSVFLNQMESDASDYDEEGIFHYEDYYEKPYHVMPFDLEGCLMENYMQPMSDALTEGNMGSVFTFNSELAHAFKGNGAEPVVTHLIANMTLGDIQNKKDIQEKYCRLITAIQYDDPYYYGCAARLWQEILDDLGSKSLPFLIQIS